MNVEPQGSLLVSIPDVQLFHLADGESSSLATGTLQLTSVSVTVPSTSSSSSSAAAAAATSTSTSTNDLKTNSGAPTLPPRPTTPLPSTKDQYLLMTLLIPGEDEPLFEMVLPATARILTQPPSSYLVPNSQPDVSSTETNSSSGSIKVTLPSSVDADTRELFEHVLWGMTSFSASAPSWSSSQPPAYDASTSPSSADKRSRLVLVDSNGDVVGALADSVSLHEDASLAQENQGEHEKEPVVVEASALAGGLGTSTPTSGHHFDFSVRPLSAFTSTPNPTNSTIITLGDYLSHGIIVGGDLVARTLEYGADSYVSKRPATQKPLVFSETTKARASKGQGYSGQAVKVSGKAAKMVGDAAAKVGDRIGKATGVQSAPSGKPPTGLRGLVNQSLIAFNTVLDAAETSAKTLLTTGGTSSAKVINHSYGSDAAHVSASVGSGAQSVFLVYLDARGVSRRALLKGVGKGALRCKMQDGREVLLTDDQGQIQANGEKSGASTPGTTTPPKVVQGSSGEKAALT